MTHQEFLLLLAVAMASGIFGYLLRTRCEQDIYDRGYRAGMQRYYRSPHQTPRQ